MTKTGFLLSLGVSLGLGLLTGCGDASVDDEDSDALATEQAATTTCTPLTPAQRGYVKWNPGHYIHGTGGNRAAQASNFVAAFGNIGAVKGLQKEYFWSEVESDTAPGQYNWNPIIADINTLKAAGKKLAIIIKYKYELSSTDSSLPQYILNLPKATVGSITGVPPFFEQGKPGDGPANHGQHANFGHPQTRARFKALLTALSEEFDDDPNVVSLSFLETSTGANFGTGGYNRALEGLFLDGVLQMERDAGCAFKHTPLFQNLNYPRGRLSQFTTNMATYGVGLGGPDVFIDAMKVDADGYCRNGLGFNVPNNPKGVYRYYPDVAPTLPIGQQVHHENFIYSTWDKMVADQPHNLSAAASVDRLYDFSMQYLKPNYMFWQVGGYDKYAAPLKARWNSSDTTQRLPLRTGCPAIYGGTCASL